MSVNASFAALAPGRLAPGRRPPPPAVRLARILIWLAFA
jgi:hypothetical protein